MSPAALRAAVLLLGPLAPLGGLAAQALKPWTGGETPALVLEDPQGRTHDLAKYHGTVVLVNFWATWCEPCRDEMPSIERARGKLAGRPFAVLAVNLRESPQKVADFLKRLPLGFPVLLDRDGDVAKAWRVRMLPASFLVDTEGRIRYSLVGDTDWADEAVVDTIKQLLQPE